jgi:general stress protein 26
MGTDENDLVWREISRIATCMMITNDQGTIRARPMVGTADRDSNTIWFVSNRSHHKDQEIAADPRVCLAYVDTESNTYVSVSGRAKVSEDREKLKELWTPSVDAWFQGGPEDPQAILIAVTPELAEVWDNPGSDLVVALKMLTASVTDNEPPNIGEHRKVSM